jgi:hypothetical protein
MRLAQVIVVGSLAALVGLTTPAFAKKADAQKSAGEKSTSASCHTYQPAPDGTWTEHPCEEVGGSTQHRPVPKSQEEEPPH